METTINDVNTLQIRNAKNGDFDIALTNSPQADPEQGVTQIRANVIQIRNAKNGDFDLHLSGAGCYSIDDLADGSEPSGDLVITSTTISDSAFRCKTGITSVVMTALESNTTNTPFQGCSGMTSFSAPLLKSVTGTGMLADCSALTSVSFPLLEKTGNVMLQGTRNLTEIWLPKVTEIPYPFVNGRSPNQSTANSVLKLGSTVTNIHANAFGGFAVSGDIYVPWSQGDIAGAPWGAGSNIVIHYDTVYDADGNVISST